MYTDVTSVLKRGRTFNYIFGGRGTGKTYSALLRGARDFAPFTLMRRTQQEVDMITSGNEEYNPFLRINQNENTNFHVDKANRLLGRIYSGDKGDEEFPVKFCGTVVALSTISTVRGVELSESNLIIFDEFIPEQHKRKIKDEASAFFNAYETISRNRELEGKKPIQVLFLTNANNLSNPILYEVGLIPTIERMLRKGQKFSDLPERDCTIWILDDEEFKDKKRKTALYKFTQGTKFSGMALENDFSFDDFAYIGKQQLVKYNPVCAIDDIGVWKGKDRESGYYINRAVKACAEKIESSNEADLEAFRRTKGHRIYMAFLAGLCTFEDYYCKEKILDIVRRK